MVTRQSWRSPFALAILLVAACDPLEGPRIASEYPFPVDVSVEFVDGTVVSGEVAPCTRFFSGNPKLAG